MKIKNLMSENIITISKEQNLSDGLKLLRKNNISRLPVVNANKELIGIVSERDIAHKLGSSKAGNLSTSSLRISSVMVKDVITVSSNYDLSEVATLMLEKGIGSVPIVDDGKLLGIVSKADFTTLATGKIFEKLYVKDYMSTDIIAVSSSDRLIHARREMCDNNVGRIPVLDDDELVGIITSKDLIRSFMAFKKNVPDKYQKAQIKNLLVEDTMSHKVSSVSSDTSIDEIANIMIDTGFNGLPVVDGNKLVGIITQTDILAIILKLESE